MSQIDLKEMTVQHFNELWNNYSIKKDTWLETTHDVFLIKCPTQETKKMHHEQIKINFAGQNVFDSRRTNLMPMFKRRQIKHQNQAKNTIDDCVFLERESRIFCS